MKGAVKAEIVVFQTIAPKDVSSGVAERVDCIDQPGWLVTWPAVSLCTVRQQGAGVEPVVWAAVSDVPVTDYVGTIRGAAGVTFVTARKNGERRPGLKGQDSGELPSAGDRAQGLVLSFAEWQIVHVAEDEAVRDVVIGYGALGA